MVEYLEKMGGYVVNIIQKAGTGRLKNYKKNIIEQQS